MSKPTHIALVVVGGFFLTASAGEQPLGKLLSNQYGGKVLYLRYSFTSDSQEYDSEGNPTKAADEGPWSLFGRILVKKVAIDRDKLRVEGKRALFKSSGHDCGRGCMRFDDGEQVTVTIRLTSPLSTATEADSVLARVFAMTLEDIMNSVPPYWQDYVAKSVAPDSKKPSPRNATSGDGGVFGLEAGITAPKALYQPEPEFSDAARRRNFQGVLGLNIIIDKTGQVSRVSLVRPLGLGLDENAANTVRTWRFDPAKHNGEPVAVAVYVEVSFHLGR
jgi:TonB family protein